MTEVPGAFINAYGGVDTLALPQGRPGDFAAQAAARDLQRAAAGVPPDYVSPDTAPLPAGVEGRGLWDLVVGQTAAADRADQLLAQGKIDEAQYTRLTRGSRSEQDAAIREMLGYAPAPTPADAVTAPVATAEAPAAPAVTPPGGYSLGLEGQPVTPARLSFGPKLGAMPDPIYGTVTDRVVANPPGQPQPVPDMQVYTMDPGRPGRELQQGIDTYSEYVRQAQIYAKYGKTREYLEMATKAKEMENTLFFLQGAQALQELAFNSPQRLSMVLSEQFGREIGIQPNQNGSWDLYADGMLAMQMSKPELSTWARTQIDSTFAASEAARAATYAEEQMKSDIQQNREIAVQRDRAQLDMRSEAIKAEAAMQKALFDARVNPANVVLEPDPAGNGDVYVYDKLAETLVGVITTRDFSNPGQSLPAPTFIKKSQ